MIENLEQSISLFRVVNHQNRGILCNSGKIPTDGGVKLHWIECPP